jgi:hypothetical protein
MADMTSKSGELDYYELGAGLIYFVWLPGAMVARLASIAQRYQKVAGSSPAVVMSGILPVFNILPYHHVT